MVPPPAGRVRGEDRTTPPYTLPLSSSSWSLAPQVSNMSHFSRQEIFFQRSLLINVDSMFIPNRSPALPLASGPSPLSFSVSTFRYRRPHRNSIRTSPTHRLCLPHGTLPALVLEPWIHSHGRAHCHDFCAGGGRD